MPVALLPCCPLPGEGDKETLVPRGDSNYDIPMRNAAILACLLASLLAAGGCGKTGWKWPRRASEQAPDTGATTQPAEPPRTREQLEKDVVTLRAEKKILEGRLEELTVRQNALAERMRELQFIKKQQDLQIEALKDAAKTRDKLQARVNELTLDVVRLKSMIETLKGEKPGATTQPTQPSTPRPARKGKRKPAPPGT